MSSRFSYTSRFTKMIIIVEFVLVAYLLYSLTKNVYNSYQVDEYITAFGNENSQLELDNQQKLEDYLYYTSEEYIDKIAKQNLGLVNPGEKVIVLSDASFGNTPVSDELNDESFAKFDEMTVPEQWWGFFFGSGV